MSVIVTYLIYFYCLLFSKQQGAQFFLKWVHVCEEETLPIAFWRLSSDYFTTHFIVQCMKYA